MRYKPGMIALTQCNATSEPFRARLLEVAEIDEHGFTVIWHDLVDQTPVTLPDLSSVPRSWGIVERPEYPADWRERLARLGDQRWSDVDHARADVQSAFGLPNTFGRIATTISVGAASPAPTG